MTELRRITYHNSSKLVVWASIILIVFSVTETAFKTERFIYPIGIVLLAICILKNGFRIRLNYTITILLYLLYVLISCIWSPSSGALRNSFVKTTVILFLFMQLQFDYIKQDLYVIKKAFIVQLCGLFTMILLFGTVDWDGRLWIKYGSESTDPNSLCSWLIIPTAVLLEYIFTMKMPLLKKLLCIALFGGIIAVCLMSGSRAGIIALAITIVICLFYLFKDSIKRNPRLLLAISVSGILLIVSIMKFAPQSVISRFSYGNTADLGGRIERWTDLLSTLFRHPLGTVFGMGEDSTVFYSAYSVVAHNMFIEILFCQGIIGLLLVILFVRGLIRNSIRSDIFAFFALVGVLTISMSLSEFTSRSVMLSFFIAGMRIVQPIDTYN